MLENTPSILEELQDILLLFPNVQQNFGVTFEVALRKVVFSRADVLGWGKYQQEQSGDSGWLKASPFQRRLCSPVK